MLDKLIILDRDGLIIEEGEGYITHPSQIRVKSGVFSVFGSLRLYRIFVEAMGNFEVLLATKQRGLSKGLLNRDQLYEIHSHLQGLIGFEFDDIYIESEKETKRDLLESILIDKNISPDRVLFVDNSEVECREAAKLGIFSICTSDLTDLRKLNIV